jgi:lipoprotein-anchoring transpeptidase ErfK/SrfK
VAAVSLNVTVTDPLSPGYVSLTPAGANDPAIKTRTTATVTVVRAAQTLPSHAIVGVSPRGFDVFTLSGAHVIADVTGYFLGTPAPAPFGVPANVNPTPAGCVGPAAAPAGAIVTGSSKAAVSRVQQRLLDLGFWLDAANGSYGRTTQQAVMAFQKANGLSRDGTAGPATLAALAGASRPTPRQAVDGIEIDLGRQLLLIVQGGQLLWAFNTSTGTSATPTPPGDFAIDRQIDGMRHAPLGDLFRPKYFNGGIAIHGSGSIPGRPASHGCARVSNAAIDFLWSSGLAPIGTPVRVH